MKLALVADWLPTYGGAEHVIAEFCSLWPDAPLHTTVAKHGKLGPLDSANIHTSSLQRWYKLLGDHKVLLPLMPQAIENIDLTGYDVVLSSSHAVGKGIVPPSTAKHICYCHTPMRYAWEMEDQYLNDFKIPNFLRKKIKNQLVKLRRWDLTTAKRVDTFIANSSTTQERIQRFYGRESIVIHPPVGDHFFDQAPQARDKREAPYLAIGRFVPYKRFDLLIEAANTLKFPLRIAGTGQDAAKLQAMAGPTVEMLGFVPDADLPELYASSRALLFPQLEDAGVVPLEAQACGTPIVALGEGGVLDTVRDGETGIFFGKQTVDSIESALLQFNTKTWDAKAIQEHAKQYSALNFRRKISSVVDQAS